MVTEKKEKDRGHSIQTKSMATYTVASSMEIDYRKGFFGSEFSGRK